MKTYDEYLQSEHWRELSKKTISMRKQCDKCGRSHGLGCHHKTYDRVGRELDGDLEVLCVGCHASSHPGKFIRHGKHIAVSLPEAGRKKPLWFKALPMPATHISECFK